MAQSWDLTALINAADPKAGQAERHLWLVRLMEWLRHAPRSATPAAPAGTEAPETARTPLPVLRLRHLLNQVEKNEALRQQVHGLAQAFWRDIDAAPLFADLGFGARLSFGSELLSRMHALLRLPRVFAAGSLDFSVYFPTSTVNAPFGAQQQSIVFKFQLGQTAGCAVRNDFFVGAFARQGSVQGQGDGVQQSLCLLKLALQLVYSSA
jgi:hypothetical protein